MPSYLTPSQLNSMAAAAATAAALKAMPPSAVSLGNGNGLAAAHLAAMAAAASAAPQHPGNPAKRPALADAKSGLPMFDCGQGLYALQPPTVVTTSTTALPQPLLPPAQQQQSPNTAAGLQLKPANGGQEPSKLDGSANAGQADRNGDAVGTPHHVPATVGQYYPGPQPPEGCESIPFCFWFVDFSVVILQFIR